MRSLLILSGALAFSAGALADGDTLDVIDPMSSAYLMKLTTGLLVVVVCIFVIAWMFKKLNIKTQAGNAQMQIIAALSVGTRDRIVVLQVGEEQILLGLTPGRIEKLHLLASPLVINQSEPVSTAFAQKLNQLMGQAKSK